MRNSSLIEKCGRSIIQDHRNIDKYRGNTEKYGEI